jgi:hypothetical protein
MKRASMTWDALDQHLDAGEYYHDREIREQLEDLTVLRAVKNFGPHVVGRIRERAVETGVLMEGAVRRLLPS